MYISIAELPLPEETLIRLTDDEGAGSVNAEHAEAAIASAQAVVDCALSRLYAVPFADPPEVVKKLTADLAVYNLYQRVGSLPPEVRAGYENVSAVLEKAAQGLFRIDAPGMLPEFSYQEREFSRGHMEGF